MKSIRILPFVIFATLSASPALAGPVEFVNPPTMFPAGDYGYSNAVTVSVPGGKEVYISGQVAFAKDGTILGKGDLRTQYRESFKSLGLALDAVGGKPSDVVKITTYVVNYNPDTDRDIIHEERAKFFGDSKPASTIVGISKLAFDGLLVEVEAVAFVPTK